MTTQFIPLLSPLFSLRGHSQSVRFVGKLLGISFLMVALVEGVRAVEADGPRLIASTTTIPVTPGSTPSTPKHSEDQTPSENSTGPFDGFCQLLSTAYPNNTSWKSLAGKNRITTADLPFLFQLLFRMNHVETHMLDRWTQAAPPLSAWLSDPAEHRAELAWVTGNVLSMEKFKIPDSLAQAQQVEYFYLCQLELGFQQEPATVISPQVPKRWLTTDTFPQPVRLRGLFLRTWQPTVTAHQSTTSQTQPASLLLATHLAWFPTQRAPPGQLFLAAHGMDVALLDEVRQRQTFVKEDVSREKEAFYACLAAVGQASAREISSLARQHLPEVTKHWRKIQRESSQRQQMLQQKITSASSEKNWKTLELAQLERQRKGTMQRVALATAVLQRASQGHYSVGPLFLEPQEQVGCLTIVEGTARRAIKIVVPTRPSSLYYELEIFTADSQNLPVVCCVSRLPAQFPLGDTIREPVHVAGIFFKSWLYRTRQSKDNNGTGRQPQLHVPLVIGSQVERLPLLLMETRRWPMSVWIGLLMLLAIIMTTLIWNTRRGRGPIRAGRQAAPKLPQRWLDTNEDRSAR